MIKLATQLRYMQFYAHNAHNMCQGDTFFSDHEESIAQRTQYVSGRYFLFRP